MKLTPTQLRDLLDRYEAAETSLAEERALRDALASPDVPPGFRPYRQWFAGLDAIARTRAVPQDGPWSDAPQAATRGTVVDAPAAATATASARGPAAGLRVAHRAPARAGWTRLAAAAAVLLVLAGALLVWRKPLGHAPIAADAESAPVPIDWSKYEVTDPVEASRITRAALAQVSQHLHRGSELTAEELARMQPIHLILNSKS